MQHGGLAREESCGAWQGRRHRELPASDGSGGTHPVDESSGKHRSESTSENRMGRGRNRADKDHSIGWVAGPRRTAIRLARVHGQGSGRHIYDSGLGASHTTAGWVRWDHLVSTDHEEQIRSPGRARRFGGWLGVPIGRPDFWAYSITTVVTAPTAASTGGVWGLRISRKEFAIQAYEALRRNHVLSQQWR